MNLKSIFLVVLCCSTPSLAMATEYEDRTVSHTITAGTLLGSPVVYLLGEARDYNAIRNLNPAIGHADASLIKTFKQISAWERRHPGPRYFHGLGLNERLPIDKLYWEKSDLISKFERWEHRIKRHSKQTRRNVRLGRITGSIDDIRAVKVGRMMRFFSAASFVLGLANITSDTVTPLKEISDSKMKPKFTGEFADQSTHSGSAAGVF